MLCRCHESDDEVLCYRGTEESLTLLEESPRDWGRKRESARGNWERLEENSNSEQRRSERGGEKGKREGEQGADIHLAPSAVHWICCCCCFPFTHILHTQKHLHAHSKCLPGGRGAAAAFEAAGQDVKLLLYAWIDSPLIPLSASRLHVPLSPVKHKARDEIKDGTTRCKPLKQRCQHWLSEKTKQKMWYRKWDDDNITPRLGVKRCEKQQLFSNFSGAPCSAHNTDYRNNHNGPTMPGPEVKRC